MKKLLPIILIFMACSTNSYKDDNAQAPKDTLLRQTYEGKDISDPTNTLNGKTETLALNYIVWGCDCANWVTSGDFKKYQDDKLAEHCIFIEPANKALELPMYFDPGRHFVKVTGQFYVRPDYPKGTIPTEEQLEKTKVFRYTEITVTEKPIIYSAKDEQILTLNYSAISCSCAQWRDSEFNNNSNKQENYYLERANSNLINADTLWQGENIPLQIQVTGQPVTEVGYPTGCNPAKENPEAGKVFRYTKIKILQNGQKNNGY